MQVANNNGARTTPLEALKITGSTFDGNLAQFGAAVAVVSGDATHPTSDTITVEGTTFTENGIPQTGVGSAQQGGGLFAQLFGASLSIDSSAFANNWADSAGGGVYFDGHSGAAATVTDTSFTNNGQYSTQFLTYTAQQGGGMYAQLFDASLTVIGGAFDSNHAIYGGGGLFLDAPIPRPATRPPPRSRIRGSSKMKPASASTPAAAARSPSLPRQRVPHH